MRVYFDVGFHSTGISRVALNLAKYLPDDLAMASDPGSADLVVMHVKGRHDHRVVQANNLLKEGKRYAVIQYVMESSRNPGPWEWQDLWHNADLVWSYYDLREYVPDMYLAPLGADGGKFYPEDSLKKKYICGTLSQDYKTECLGEVRLAAYLEKERLIHIGDMEVPDPNSDNIVNISDDELRKVYNQCHYFSALRRKDGFELIAAESILCGVSPIMFDAPRFRLWFDEFATFIPESTPKDVVYSLRELFSSSEIRQVGDLDRARELFNWERIIKGFWERIKR